MHTADTHVTAIIPTYNRAKYLSQAIASVLGQSAPPSQVIVIDDGSQDETPDVVAAFGSRVEYIAKPNGGKSSALNVGLRRATGTLIWIFDDDDIAEPDALAKLVSALQNHPQCGFAYGDYDVFTVDDGGRMKSRRVSFPAADAERLYLALMERCFILQQGLLVRKSCYDAVGDFDETLIRSQDLDMILRLASRYLGVKIPGIAFHWRQHSGMRGSKNSVVSADRVVDAWVASGRKILGRIYDTHDLRDFLPGASYSRELTNEQKVTALLQRCCIMARKGMWHEAAQDLRQVREIAQANGTMKLNAEETAILRPVFDLFSFAPHTFYGAAEFRSVLNEIRPKPLQRDMRAAIVWSLPFTVGAVLLHRQYANFWRFLRIYLVLATPGTVLRTIFSRSFLAAAMELVCARCDTNATRGDAQTTPSVPAA
ncbi:MAG TPA: glycosyltransferase [Bryobacteraceae bacterium]